MVSLGLNWTVEAVTSCKQLFIERGFHQWELIVTKGKKTVIIYNIENREPVKSWTCKPNEYFTSEVIYDFISNQLVGVINSKALRLWTTDCSCLDEGEKIHFSSDIYRILNTVDHQPIIVFQNGCIEFLQTSLNNPKSIKTSCLKEGEVIQAYEILSKPSHVEIALLTSGQANEDCVFTLVFLNSSGVEEKRISRPLCEIVNPGCFCFIKTETLSLFSSNSPTKEEQINNGGSEFAIYKLQSGEIKMVTDDSSLKYLPDWQDCKHFYAVYLENYHLGVMRIYDDETVISIWDLSFGIEKISKKISGQCELKMWTYFNCLLFINSDKLNVMPYTTEEPSLSTVVGSKSLNKNEGAFCHLKWNGKKSSPSIIGKAQRISLKSFTSKSSDSLKLMINQGLSTSVISREIFNSLIENEDTKGIGKALQFFVDIPEDTMVQLLKYLFKSKTEVGSGKTTETCKECFPYINLVLNLSFSDVILQDEIKNLPLDFIKILLEYLQTTLSNHSEFSGESSVSLFKITDWLCIILDAHFYNLIFLEDEATMKILLELNTIIKSQFSYLEELEKLEGILNLLKMQQPAAESYSYYNIQILRIS